MKILFKFATRSRPEKFFSCLENIEKMIDDKINYHILISCDKDDVTMPHAETLSRIYALKNMTICWGKSINKIDAINRDMDEPLIWDTLINTSDDMVFTKQGFDNIIREDMNKYFPDLDGFLHYNDGNQKSNVCTMSIMGRKYYERFNYIYHPDYKSVWCDVEQTEVAYMLGKYRYMGDENVLFHHLHPAWGLGEYDEQYRASENLDVWGEDLKTLLERKSRNYDLTPGQITNALKYSDSEKDKWQRELNNARRYSGMKEINFQ